MESILIFIKHHLGFLWKVIEWGNGIIFSLLYKSRMNKVTRMTIDKFGVPPYSYRRLNQSDAEALYELINSQEASDIQYFNPHGFDLNSISSQSQKRAFLMMGAFNGEILAGYFFLRFFANKKCFVGRLIDKEYRGKGLGTVMNDIMYEISWTMQFRCLSTISRNNSAVMRAHAKNPSMIVLMELPNDYLLVEFIRKKK
jgi:hypothetical protein